MLTHAVNPIFIEIYTSTSVNYRYACNLNIYQLDKHGFSDCFICFSKKFLFEQKLALQGFTFVPLLQSPKLCNKISNIPVFIQANMLICSIQMTVCMFNNVDRPVLKKKMLNDYFKGLPLEHTNYTEMGRRSSRPNFSHDRWARAVWKSLWHLE